MSRKSTWSTQRTSVYDKSLAKKSPYDDYQAPRPTFHPTYLSTLYGTLWGEEKKKKKKIKHRTGRWIRQSSSGSVKKRFSEIKTTSSAEETSAKETSKEILSKETSAEETSAKEASAEDTSAEETSAQETSGEETSVEDTSPQTSAHTKPQTSEQSKSSGHSNSGQTELPRGSQSEKSSQSQLTATQGTLKHQPLRYTSSQSVKSSQPLGYPGISGQHVVKSKTPFTEDEPENQIFAGPAQGQQYDINGNEGITRRVLITSKNKDFLLTLNARKCKKENDPELHEPGHTLKENNVCSNHNKSARLTLQKYCTKDLKSCDGKEIVLSFKLSKQCNGLRESELPMNTNVRDSLSSSSKLDRASFLLTSTSSPEHPESSNVARSPDHQSIRLALPLSQQPSNQRYGRIVDRGSVSQRDPNERVNDSSSKKDEITASAQFKTLNTIGKELNSNGGSSVDTETNIWKRKLAALFIIAVFNITILLLR